MIHTPSVSMKKQRSQLILTYACPHFFSFSFQYGFTKVRRGPDTDMYAHQSFIRGKPELLLNLRKCSSASRRKMSSASTNSSESCDSSSSSGMRNQQTTFKKEPQVISHIRIFMCKQLIVDRSGLNM